MIGFESTYLIALCCKESKLLYLNLGCTGFTRRIQVDSVFGDIAELHKQTGWYNQIWKNRWFATKLIRKAPPIPTIYLENTEGLSRLVSQILTQETVFPCFLFPLLHTY